MSFISYSIRDTVKASSVICKASSGVAGLPSKCAQELTRLIDGDALVQSLGICKSPISSNDHPFTHHYLIVEVGHVQINGAKDKSVGFIRAEKGMEEGRGVISLECPQTVNEAEMDQDRVCTLEGCGKMSMKVLIHTLEAESSNYSLFRKNCWEYADKTFRKLINEFANLPDTRSETKTRLQSYLAGLRDLRLPADAFVFNLRAALKCLGVSIFTTGVTIGTMVGILIAQIATYAASAKAAGIVFSVTVPFGSYAGLGVGIFVGTAVLLYLLWMTFKFLRGLRGGLNRSLWHFKIYKFWRVVLYSLFPVQSPM